MKRVEKETMIEFIISCVKKNKISIYSIFKATKITQSAIANIVNQKVKNPHEVTVKAIYKYLLNNYGSEEDKLKLLPNSDSKTEGDKVQLSEFEEMLNKKIREIVKELTTDKFNDINESLLFLIRKSFDVETESKASAKNVIDKIN